jgi:hypothetical protein
MHQVVVSHAAFAEVEIGGEPSRSNDDGRQALSKEIERVVEAGAEYWGWVAVILGGSKHNDGFRWMEFVIS